MQPGNDACLVALPYVLLLLMVCQLSGSSFERCFCELTSMSTAAAFVEKNKEKQQKAGCVGLSPCPNPEDSTRILCSISILLARKNSENVVLKPNLRSCILMVAG